MSAQTLFTTLIVVLFLFGIWATHSKSGKIFCIYEGKDKTVERKWVKVTDNFVVFGGKKFYIITECVQSFWDRGGIHAFFPTRVNYLGFVHYSKYPRNPNDYKQTWDTPELNNLMNLGEQLKSFFKNFTPPTTAKKVTGIMQYIPIIIVIVLLVVVAFYLNSQMDGMKQVINMMQNQINSITPR